MTTVAVAQSDTWSDEALLMAIGLVEKIGWRRAAEAIGYDAKELFAVVSEVHADLAASEAAPC